MTETKPNPKKADRNLTGYVVLFIAVIALTYLASMTLVKKYVVPSASMEPTISVGSTIYTSPLIKNTTPNRGDIILFTIPESWNKIPKDTVYVKRVIGLPGETITCCGEDGQILINGEPLVEPYLKEGSNNAAGTTQHWEYIIPEKHYFVMGDNRSGSKDSRHHDQPFIHENLILPHPLIIHK